MSKSIEALIFALKEAAHEEIMLRESGDTSDKWQDEASPENVLLLIAEVERLNSPEIPDGWKLTPIKPTAEMMAAAMECDDVVFDFDDNTIFCVQFDNIYAAMLAAATEPQNQQQNITEIIPQGWIKCSDQMPENDERKPVAVYTGNCLGQGMFVASYDDNEFSDYWEGTEIKGVTHWMPLPAAPEKENG